MKDERTQKTRINLYTGQCLGKKGENLKIQKKIYIFARFYPFYVRRHLLFVVILVKLVFCVRAKHRCDVRRRIPTEFQILVANVDSPNIWPILVTSHLL